MRAFFWTWLVASSAVGMLLVAGGCGSDSEASSDSSGAPPAAINGGDNAASEQIASPDGLDTMAGPSLAGPADDPLHPVVAIETGLGAITVRLDAEKADLTVENFLSYVEKGHYDGTIFHQVLENYVVLGGGYTRDFSEKLADTTIFNQANNGLRNVRGTIAMARDPQVIDSATCQFFINVADNPQLDHQGADSADTYGYCVFGEVEEGMDVVDRISRVAVQDTDQFERTPVEPVVIQSIRRIR